MAAKFGGLSKLVKKPSTTSAEAENEQEEEMSEMLVKLGKQILQESPELLELQKKAKAKVQEDDE